MEITLLEKSTLTKNDIDFSALEKLGNVKYYDILNENELIKVVKDSQYIICNKTVFDEKLLRYAKNLKYIGLLATGFNNINLEIANKMGITVCNAPNYSTDSVAQLTITFLLELASSLHKYNESVNNGDWISSNVFSYFPYSFCELKGKTLGIVGYGDIGKSVAKLAKAFDMNILVFSRTIKDDKNVTFVDKETLFRNSDFITLHCPLNENTKNLICQETLKFMKPTAYLINTSRGGVVCEKDLANALNNGLIAGAGLDVLSVEPMAKENPLYRAKNCLITPHIAWTTLEARTRLIDIVATNLKKYLEGNPQNVVNNK